MARPTKFPEWAINDISDPISGEPNVVEPPQQKKDDGWLYKEKPPAAFQNWQQRLNYQWLEYLDSERRLLPYAVAEEDTTNNYIIDFTGVFSAFTDQMFFRCTFDQPNTGAVFITVDPISGAKELINNATGAALAGGEILVNREYLIAYNVATTKLHMLTSVQATEVHPGIIQIATQAEMIAATNLTKAGTPGHISTAIQQNTWTAKEAVGPTNVYTVTTIPSFTPLSGSRLYLSFQNSNTGAATLNVNGIGALPIKTNTGSTLIGGEIQSTQRLLLQNVGGVEWVILSARNPATKALMEGATGNNTVATPGNMIDHPGIAKAWVYYSTFSGSYVEIASHNIASGLRVSTGLVTITTSVTFKSSTDFGVNVSTRSDGSSLAMEKETFSRTANIVQILRETTGGAPIDGKIFASFFGTLA